LWQHVLQRAQQIKFYQMILCN
ncbi:tRNA pseudouridine synthase D, partial [Haemophilus influenzae]